VGECKVLLDEPALNVGSAACDKFNAENDVDLQNLLLWDMLSNHPVNTKVRAAKTPPLPATQDEGSDKKGPVKWGIKF
jgi:hypothetical protein